MASFEIFALSEMNKSHHRLEREKLIEQSKPVHCTNVGPQRSNVEQ